MNMETEGDEVNTQDLQAQIDLSMSFAQSLASSWIKPRRNGANTSSRRTELEHEIWEAAKRPSRLGVGTPVSQASQNTSREAARLKGQLVGKRTRREDEEAKTKRDDADSHDADEESRARAITKRVKVDPFESSSKKKQKQSLQVMVNGPGVSSMAPAAEETTPDRRSELTKVGDDVSIPFKPFEPNWRSSTAFQKGASRGLNDKGNSATLGTLSPSEEGPSTQEEYSKPGFLALVPPLSPSATLPPELLKRPLLNLSEHSGSEDNSLENPSSSSPKKKRKRKKKKKKLAEMP